MANVNLHEVAVDWYLNTYRLRASRLVSESKWFAVFDPEFAVSHDGNQLIAHEWTDADLEAKVDSLFAETQIRHRAITTFADIPVTSVLALHAAGYDRTDFVLMAAAPTDLRPQSRGIQVEALSEPESADFSTATWAVERPGMPSETVADLVARRCRLDLAGTVHRLGIRDSSTTVVAACDFVIRGKVAEVDAVAVSPGSQSHGLGDALLAECIRLAMLHEIETVVLTALAADWPRDWYAKRGFAEVGTEQSFVRIL